jgi:LuxR family transcriptional regulator, maltose regulon positive regulatory protein
MTAPAVVATPAVPAPGDVLDYAMVARGPWPARRPARHAWVRRPRLVRPLQDPDSPPLVAVVAPAGYGKTALLREWAERDQRPFAWVTVDERDNHGARLSTKVARALAAVQPAGTTGRVVVVLDDLHLLHKHAALDALSAIVGNLDPEVTLALASRSRLALPIARFREQRLVTELGPRDLAMTKGEAASLLRLAGLDLDHSGVGTLLRRTEGWPAGLSLAALALGERATGPAAPNRFGGEDRLVADYVRDEILRGLSADQLEFVLSTSVLDTLTGPLCDAVLERSGSATTLSGLAGSNLLLVPLDRTDERYRYHRLLGETLRAELRRRKPELEPELHRRASAWHQDAGDPDHALHHAICAGDIEGAGDLVWSSVTAAIGHGRQASIDGWLGRFTDVQIAAHPTLALAAANSELARGQGDLVDHWAAAAAAAADRPAAVEAGVAIMRAALARDGIPGMESDADRAYRLEPEDSPWRSLCCLLAGTAQLVVGRRDDAVRQLEEGARRAAVVAPDVHALCLAQLGVLALMQEDWEEAAGLVARARSQIERHGLAASATVALVFAASALVRCQRARIEDAHSDLQAAMRLHSTMTDFAPWYDVELGILMARTAVRLSDANFARGALVAASRRMRRVPEATVLEAWLQDAWARLDAFTGQATAPSPVLTPAELRILQFLPTHLSFREIAERTYVSTNTVKSQANAVYRKLDVSGRSEAVGRAREVGLLDGPPPI